VPEPVTCAECGAEFVTTRDHAWCSDRCADAAWARMHPNVPVRRPGRHRGNADQLRPPRRPDDR
jgi:endogenous inhibitor of DNA gyrase (YacG/DUF329 family)